MQGKGRNHNNNLDVDAMQENHKDERLETALMELFSPISSHQGDAQDKEREGKCK